ncbi:hypothetical protein K0M31_013924 [Melipona bicolor]|uniref:Uncharacterized protein n=1 Tax=Melipona bicolor TaxID=60889 RepID=A0AA40KTT0_9HYME|nr:hypothetical protein K0M31_013924 [Melipona bicolor]
MENDDDDDDDDANDANDDDDDVDVHDRLFSISLVVRKRPPLRAKEERPRGTMQEKCSDRKWLHPTVCSSVLCTEARELVPGLPTTPRCSRIPPTESSSPEEGRRCRLEQDEAAEKKEEDEEEEEKEKEEEEDDVGLVSTLANDDST